ncbi:hypothetical protein [Paraburkholderia sp.]
MFSSPLSAAQGTAFAGMVAMPAMRVVAAALTGVLIAMTKEA